MRILMRFLLNCLHASTSPSCQFCCLESFMLLYRVWSPQFPAFLLWKAFGMYHKPPEEKQRDSKFWAIVCVVLGFIYFVGLPLRSYLFRIAGATSFKWWMRDVIWDHLEIQTFWIKLNYSLKNCEAQKSKLLMEMKFKSYSINAPSYFRDFKTHNT